MHELDRLIVRPPVYSRRIAPFPATRPCHPARATPRRTRPAELAGMSAGFAGKSVRSPRQYACHSDVALEAERMHKLHCLIIRALPHIVRRAVPVPTHAPQPPRAPNSSPYTYCGSAGTSAGFAGKSFRSPRQYARQSFVPLSPSGCTNFTASSYGRYCRLTPANCARPQPRAHTTPLAKLLAVHL